MADAVTNKRYENKNVEDGDSRTFTFKLLIFFMCFWMFYEYIISLEDPDLDIFEH